MLPRKASAGIIAAIAAAMVVRVAVVWSDLPPVVASHFGPSGRADGFMARGSFFAVMAVAWAVVVGLPPLLTRVVPAELVNVPNREYWLAAERREETLRRIRAWLGWFGVAMSAFLAGVVELTLRANLSRSNLNEGAFVAMLAGFLAVVAAMLVSLFRRFRLPASA